MSPKQSNTQDLGSCITETFDRQNTSSTRYPTMIWVLSSACGVPRDTERTGWLLHKSTYTRFYSHCAPVLFFHLLNLRITQMMYHFNQCKQGNWECNALLKHTSCSKAHRCVLIFEKMNHSSKLSNVETECLKVKLTLLYLDGSNCHWHIFPLLLSCEASA